MVIHDFVAWSINKLFDTQLCCRAKDTVINVLSGTVTVELTPDLEVFITDHIDEDGVFRFTENGVLGIVLGTKKHVLNPWPVIFTIEEYELDTNIDTACFELTRDFNKRCDTACAIIGTWNWLTLLVS